MKTIRFPYGRKHLSHDFHDDELIGVMESTLAGTTPEKEEAKIAQESLRSPINSPRLKEMVKKVSSVVIISSDHTRPVPSKILMPLLLQEIREGNPDCAITILVATGCHRATTHQELIDRYGEQIVTTIPIEIHDCDAKDLVDLGPLPSGNRFLLNRTAAQAQLLIAEGFIEPHFFAGFSGGRKAVLPGVSGRSTVMYNHSAQSIAHPNSRTGCLDHNPIHEDMCAAAKMANLSFILNVVLNAKKQIVASFAGDPISAHQRGTEYIRSLCACKEQKADIVITTNGGYPLDQNVYQSVKGMSTAERCCKPGGVIIMLSECGDGHGADSFYEMLKKEKDNEKLLKEILERKADDTIPDQWQTQIFLRILSKFKVIFVSDAPEQMIRDLHLIPAQNLPSAIEIAKTMTSFDAKILAIPDGVSTLIEA